MTLYLHLTISYCVPITPNQNGAETPAYVYSHYFLGRRATALARIDLLNKLSQNKDILPTASQQPPVQLVVARPFQVLCKR